VTRLVGVPLALAPSADPVATAQQRAAIEAPMGPVLVLAGPGAGKTFCLIGRIQFLIGKHGFKPERICAVTFTNKAAEEIVSRLHQALGPAGDDVTSGTLHHLCLSVLRDHAERIDLEKGFGVADEEYQKTVLRRLRIQRKRWNQVLVLFGRRRLQGYALTDGDERVFRQYQDALREKNVIDFDDIVALTQRLFAEDARVAGEVAGRWDYVLVDEFQDLNSAQYAIVKRLAESHRNLFGVGDDEQSIYSWAGADPAILAQFQRDFDIAAPIVLDRNRRCSRQIFQAARRLLAHNPALFDKRIEADRDSEYQVTAYAFPDEQAEAEWLIGDLAADQKASGMSWGEHAVLYRRHAVGEELEKGMVAAGIPCRLTWGRSLEDDPVIAHVVCSLRLIAAPDDAVAIESFARRVLPEYVLEEVFASRQGPLASLGVNPGVSPPRAHFLDLLRAHARARPKGEGDTKKLWRFVYHVENLRALYEQHGTLGGLVDELLTQRVGAYRNPLEDRADDLSDPADFPGAQELAERLEEASSSRRPVRIPCARGLEIAFRGMLIHGGIRGPVTYLPPKGSAGPGELLLPLDPLLVFKALQVMQSRDFDRGGGLTDYVTFDLETTDTNPTECEIVEIGAVRVRGGEPVEEFRSLIRPGKAVSAGARQVHGYGDEELGRAPSFAEVWPAFRKFAGSDVLVAHNGQDFDVPVLKRLVREVGGGDEGLVFYDTLPLARSLFPAGARLADLASRFGVDTGRAHHALDDSRTLARVFRELSLRRTVRARKAAAISVLDYLGLALALESKALETEERALLANVSRPYTLGRFSDCLEFYEAERARADAPDAPSLEEVIGLLGGRSVMERIRAERTAAERYPSAVSRLKSLVDASTSGGEGVDQGIQRMLEKVALSTSEGVEADPHRVNLLTLHSTKGLEFSRVYVVGVEDYQIPGYYATVDKREDEIQEARRLLYVGMTRAKDRLVLTRVAERGGKPAGESRFLEEIGVEPIAP
jgi:DNA polymerase III epsilon subunit family exonuclease